MPNKTIVFTSINLFYLPKALALGRSVIQSNPNFEFAILLAEKREKIDYIKLKAVLKKNR